MAHNPIIAAVKKWRESFQRILKAEQGGDSDVQAVFRGSVVFITGGTGFVGKQLLEKLLRSCRGIQKVYLLVRVKKGKTIAERMERQWKDPLYDELRSIDPGFSKRVFPIQGDVAELRLGINDSVWNRIKSEINFIFHIAATVKFNEPLQKAVLINVRGTRELLNLASGVPNLKALVHVSSAYANCNREKEVHEVIYDTPIKPEILVEMAESMEAAKFEALSKTLTEGWPNTYTFSKAVAENLIKTMGNLPICVIRPSIITPTIQEPALGWMELSNLYGPTGVLLGSGLGVLHTFYADCANKFDLVPLDYVNNLAITAAWDTVKRGEAKQRDLKIYTCSRKRNPTVFNDLYQFLSIPAREMASPKALWYCFNFVTKNRWLFLLYTIILHVIPGLIIDAVLTTAGDKPRLTHVYLKAYKMNFVFRYFLFKEWIFHDDNALELKHKMSKVDKEIYNFDVTNIVLSEFMTAWCLGLRSFIIRDGLKDTEFAVRKQKWLRAANYAFFALYGLALWFILRGVFNILCTLAYVLSNC